VHIEHSIKAGILLLPDVVLNPPNILTLLGTNTFAMYPTIIDGQRYVLIDTPGFNDGTREDVEIFCEILDWFVTMTPYCDLTGILYVHNILSNRSTGAAELNLEVLQALCGERFYKNITIITTMWSDLGINGVIKTRKRQEELIDETWKELIAGSARVHEYWHPPEPGPYSNKPLPTAPEPRNTEVQHENAEDQHQTEPNFMDLHEKVLSKLCNMMAYYKGSERVRPTIQDELRRNVPIMDTKAGKVLVEKYNLPRPTTTRPVDDESSNIPSSPSSVPAATEQIDDDVSSTLSPISSSSPLSRPPETTGQIDNESNSTLRPLNPLRATTEQTGNDSSSTLSLPSLPDLVSRPPETTEQIDNQSNSTLRPPNLTGATTEQTINSDSNILSPVKLPSRPSRPNRPAATTGESSSTSRSASTLQATIEQSHGDVSSTRGPPNRQIANGRALSQSQPTEMTALVARRQTANSRASSRSRQPQSSELTALMVYRSSGRTRTKKTPFKKTPPNYSEEGEEGEEKDKDEKPKGGWFMNMIWAIRWFFGYGEL